MLKHLVGPLVGIGLQHTFLTASSSDSSMGSDELSTGTGGNARFSGLRMARRLTSQSEERDLRDYIRAIFGQRSGSKIVSALADLVVPQPYKIHIKLVYSRQFPVNVLRTGLGRSGLEEIGGTQIGFLYRATVGIKNRREVNLPFACIPLEDQGVGASVAAILAVCPADDWKNLIRRISKFYPKIASILLSQRNLINAVSSLQKKTQDEIRVRTLTAKETIPGSGKGRTRSVREWTDETLGQILSAVEEKQQILTSLAVDFYPTVEQTTHVIPHASCVVRKQGEIDVSSGFRVVLDGVVSYLARIGERKLQFLSERGMRETNYSARPLSIEYSSQPFASLATVREFVATLGSYKHSMQSVMHGNPYAHVTVTDIVDGSSVDVWAVPPNKVALVPGLRASEAALERIIAHIFDEFREGQIAEYEPGGKILASAEE